MATEDEEDEEEEDFSFPAILIDNHPASSIDSPPLWHLSPAASPVHSSNKQEKEDCFAAKPKEYYNIYKQRKSCSNIEDDLDEEEEEEEEKEKMDILWEDFNEELPRNYSKSCSKLETKRRNMVEVELGRVQSLKLSKSSNNNGSLFSSRKTGPPGIFVFIKVLKKVFLLQNSHPSAKNNRPC